MIPLDYCEHTTWREALSASCSSPSGGKSTRRPQREWWLDSSLVGMGTPVFSLVYEGRP